MYPMSVSTFEELNRHVNGELRKLRVRARRALSRRGESRVSSGAASPSQLKVMQPSSLRRAA